MNRISAILIGMLAGAVLPALGQGWEIGGAAGGGFYTSQQVTGTSGNANATVAPGLSASAWLGNDSGRLLGGEVRYDFGDGDLKLSSGGTTAQFSSQTHAIHYDFLLHFAPRGARLRPFVAAGGGVKLYEGTGQPQVYQPLENVAILTNTNDTVPMVSLGAGVKFAVTPSFMIRVYVHDYLNPFPNKVIAPAIGSKSGGWLNDFVPALGVAFTF
jgi:hypothetical protein